MSYDTGACGAHPFCLAWPVTAAVTEAARLQTILRLRAALCRAAQGDRNVTAKLTCVLAEGDKGAALERAIQSARA